MKYKKRNYKKNTIITVIVGVLVALVYEGIHYLLPLESKGNVQLAKCVDGDTARFYIDGKEEKVRFLAIDTPESVKVNTPIEPYGKEASDFTCSLLSEANDITLEFEEDKYDKYDRMLAWVFVDGKLLQEELLKEGYAQVKYVYDDYKYINRIKKAQVEAKRLHKGIWK